MNPFVRVVGHAGRPAPSARTGPVVSPTSAARHDAPTPAAGGVRPLPGGEGSAPKPLVVCFGPSGAGAQYFRPFAAAGLSLWSMRYPGRETRRAEPFAPSVAHLADEALHALPALPGVSHGAPVVVMGHSLGAAVAAEVAMRLAGDPVVRVAHLVLSGRAAPASRRRHDVGRRDAADQHGDADLRRVVADDDALRRWAVDLGGIPAELLADAGFVSMFLPILRADLLASLSYDPVLPDPPALMVPLTLLCGRDDPLLQPGSMWGWSALTSGPVRSRLLVGGHDAVVTDTAAALHHLMGARAVKA